MQEMLGSHTLIPRPTTKTLSHSQVKYLSHGEESWFPQVISSDVQANSLGWRSGYEVRAVEPGNEGRDTPGT